MSSSKDPERGAAEVAAVMGGLARRMGAASPEGARTPTQRSVLHRVDAEGPLATAALARAGLVRPQPSATALAPTTRACTSEP